MGEIIQQKQLKSYEQKKGQFHYTYFFGSNNYSWIKKGNCLPYEDEAHAKLRKKRKSKVFLDAMKYADEVQRGERPRFSTTSCGSSMLNGAWMMRARRSWVKRKAPSAASTTSGMPEKSHGSLEQPCSLIMMWLLALKETSAALPPPNPSTRAMRHALSAVSAAIYSCANSETVPGSITFPASVCDRLRLTTSSGSAHGIRAVGAGRIRAEQRRRSWRKVMLALSSFARGAAGAGKIILSDICPCRAPCSRQEGGHCR